MKRFIVLALIALMFTSCGTVPPTVIGSDTRAGIDTLSSQQTESAITVERLESSTVDVKQGLDALVQKAPDPWKPEVQKLVEKSVESVELVETLQKQLSDERNTTKRLKESAGKDSAATAQIAADKEKAEKGELKAKNQRNIAYGIIAIICGIVGICAFLKVKKII